MHAAAARIIVTTSSRSSKLYHPLQSNIITISTLFSSMSMAKDDIFQTLQRNVSSNGGGDREASGMMLAHCDGEEVVAMNAIRHLVASGKISLEDAKSAIEISRAANDSKLVTENDVTSSNKSAIIQKMNGKTDDFEKSKRGEEKYRTRHVALQFSYDGTDFTGFAQNIGKENDNSIEKALFAALEKTRLLVSPEEQGMLVMNKEDEEWTIVEKKEGMGSAMATDDASISARTASKYSRCGRTDKGVHAQDQVVALYLKSAFPLNAHHAEKSLDDDDDVVASGKVLLLGEDALPKNSLDGIKCLVPSKQKSKDGSNNSKQASFQQKVITEYDYPRILNNVLPPSIRILGWCPVSSEFSARFSCSSRTYRYFFPRRNLNLANMAIGLQYMMGRNDFRNMAKMNCEQVYNFERVLMRGKVVSPQRVYITSMEDGAKVVDFVGHNNIAHASPHDMCHVEIIGQAFLWHQIRCIMSILFYIGRDLESPEIVKELLDVETNPAKPSYDMASETALVLHRCQFSNLTFGRTVRNLWDVTKVLERRWENHAVAAERAKDALESIKEESEVRWTDVVEFIEQIHERRRRKERKGANKIIEDGDDIRQKLDQYSPKTNMMSWASAINVIQAVLGVYSYPPNGSNQDQKGQTESTLHIPIMERSKGTTYEEKVQSILGEGNGKKSSKRKDRYEENVIKKRKSTEEDQQFYMHMLKQGGSSV